MTDVKSTPMLVDSALGTSTGKRSNPSDMKELPPIQLASDRTKRVMFDNLADLFSIIVAIEHVETAYVRDVLSEKDYSKTCSKLIAQFKTLHEAVADTVPDIEAFMKEYHMTCKYAANRIKLGVPATVYHGSGGDAGEKGQELKIFHAVQAFITTMDTLKLDMKAVDELHPQLTELVESLNKVTTLPPDHESKAKVKDWLVRLNKMKAHDELSVDDARQMAFDLDNAYNAFHRFVQEKK